MTASLKSRILSGGAWAFGGRILSMAANFVAVGLLARLLGRDGLGEYGFALSFVTVGAAIASLGVQFAAVRLVATSMATDHPGRASGAVATVLRYGLLGNALAAVALLAGGIGSIGAWSDNAALVRFPIAIVAWLVLTSLQVVLAEVFRGFQDLRLATLSGGAITWTVTVILLVTVWATHTPIDLHQAFWIVVAASAGNVLFALILLRTKLRRLGPAESVGAWAVLGIALPLWANGITANVQGQVDVWVLQAYLKNDLGVYFLATRTVAMVTTWLLLVNTIVPPFIAELYARGETKRLERVLRRTATVAGIPAFGVLLVFLAFGAPILRIVGGPDYQGAPAAAGAVLLTILSIGQVVVVAGAPASITLAMTGHQKVLMWITLGSSTLTVLATWWAARNVGAVGVACAAASGQIALTVATWLATRLCTGMWTHVGPVRLSELRELVKLDFALGGTDVPSVPLRGPRSPVHVTIALVVALGCGAPPPPDSPTRMDTYWSLARRELRPWMKDEERAIALAAWIARNGTNDHRRKVQDGVPFLSLCGYRSTVFQRLGARAGLLVRRVALDDFAGSGHAAVEVRYDGAWHFLDVTYAGYFRVDGRILSFDEIQARPAWALPGLVVLDGSIDRWGDGTPVDNAQRMRRNYTPENLRTARRLPLLEPPAPRSGAQS